MAEYVRYRVTAAKVGVTMALLGLISGVAERAQAKQTRAPDKSKSVGCGRNYLKLDGLNKLEKSVFVKLEQKLDKVLIGLGDPLTGAFYDKNKSDLWSTRIAHAHQ